MNDFDVLNKLLLQQVELLAEKSKNCPIEYLPKLSMAMSNLHAEYHQSLMFPPCNDEDAKKRMILSDIEAYCLAKALQSVLFSDEFNDGNSNLFYGCRFCKYQKECSSGEKLHSNMIFDRLRSKLGKAAGVDLSLWSHQEKFKDLECYTHH